MKAVTKILIVLAVLVVLLGIAAGVHQGQGVLPDLPGPVL